MLIGISSSFDLDAGLDELLVIISEPLRTRGVVGQEEESKKSAEDRDQTIDDELESCQLLFVHVLTSRGRAMYPRVRM
jgi:hypothetical protein